jgi:hypothetical protein
VFHEKLDALRSLGYHVVSQKDNGDAFVVEYTDLKKEYNNTILL